MVVTQTKRLGKGIESNHCSLSQKRILREEKRKRRKVDLEREKKTLEKILRKPSCRKSMKMKDTNFQAKYTERGHKFTN